MLDFRQRATKSAYAISQFRTPTLIVKLFGRLIKLTLFDIWG